MYSNNLQIHAIPCHTTYCTFLNVSTLCLEKQAVKIKAHKYMLHAASSVFAVMFSKRFAQPDPIKVTDIDPIAFKEMLR